MAVRKGATRSSDPRKSRGDSIKDEVYRQMFRLEAAGRTPTSPSQSPCCAGGSHRIPWSKLRASTAGSRKSALSASC